MQFCRRKEESAPYAGTLLILMGLNLRPGGRVGLGGGRVVGNGVGQSGGAVEQGTALLDAGAEDAHIVRARGAVAGPGFLQ